MKTTTNKTYKRQEEKILADLCYKELQRGKRKLIKFLEKKDRETKDFSDELVFLTYQIIATLPLIVTKRAKKTLWTAFSKSKKRVSKKTDKLDDFNINWNLRNDEAAIYINNLKELHLSQRQWSISRTTKLGIIDIIKDWVNEWISYWDMAEQITKKDPFIFSKARAELIAVNEIGRAYEYWNFLPMKELKNKWEEVKKKWITAWDKRVRPSHQQNGWDWWIDLDLYFTWTGTKIAPSGFRCRCSVIYDIQ